MARVLPALLRLLVTVSRERIMSWQAGHAVEAIAEVEAEPDDCRCRRVRAELGPALVVTAVK